MIFEIYYIIHYLYYLNTYKSVMNYLSFMKFSSKLSTQFNFIDFYAIDGYHPLDDCRSSLEFKLKWPNAYLSKYKNVHDKT